MRVTEKTVAIMILALSAWSIFMWAATRFQGNEPNRILRVELGSDAASLDRAVQPNDSADKDGIVRNIQTVVRNTDMDLVLNLLYWLTFLALALLAGRLGERVLAVCSALLISGAALCDLFENGAILTAMRVQPFTDTAAADIAEFSQWKWFLFFLAALFLGLASAMNHHVSAMRRLAGGLFIACGVFGLLGIARYRVALDFAMSMINVAHLLLVPALLLTLWKIYFSLKELDHSKHASHGHA